MQNNQELRLQDVANPNVSVVMTSENGTVRFVRETRNTTGEVVSPDEAGQTVETITITRKELQQLS